ncbi:CYTH domain-containing protein [Clostridium aminobutyricum]|uniref:CYTH domain-containing protein n=1 Tax=Clostridium aminobutyricum TaxID=33953 RepID=A0A939DC96_CLOAM|nr:CYTH domain-containing protein [Clostridium aminobutyricum]MBN7774618.1 CYTH domain-containing protein [Clostridium aminobutyricum]
MKYGIGDKETAENIWDDEYLLSIEEADTREKVFMKAAYFDTEDFVLSRNDIALRVRMEGTRIVATLKWRGKNEGGLHTREELNVPVTDEACFIAPDPQLFKESEIGQEVIALIGFKKLHSILETNFLRSRFRIDSGEGIMEVSIDTGEIITSRGTEPICELEIELFSGEERALEAVTHKVAEKYDLTPETRSKYARGLALLGLR